MTNVITELNATNYNGRFEYQTATGSFNADGQRKLSNINGSAEGLGSFDANRYGDGQWNYNPHFQDPTKASALIALMTGAINSIQAELDGQN